MSRKKIIVHIINVNHFLHFIIIFNISYCYIHLTWKIFTSNSYLMNANNLEKKISHYRH